MSKYVGVKGMNDVLPQDSYKWLYLESVLHQWLANYGYKNIRTPLLEHTDLFTRSIGEVTDIVEKEMYSFVDQLNQDKLTLRPEGTAGVVRSVIEHNLLYNSNQKLWYIGAMFRHERPQKGRYRQFHQLGVEALGFSSPQLDCEMIVMLNDLWVRLGLKNIKLEVNCLGNNEERKIHRQELIKYLAANLDKLDLEAKNRLYSNPLRILDSKNIAMQEVLAKAPKLYDYLGVESLNHYTELKELLTSLNIKYTENHSLVRGLDYYNLTVFEFISCDLGAQATVCGGGRYDPLISSLGGKSNYACGFGLGLERLLLLLEAQNQLPVDKSIDIYIINEGAGTASYSFKVSQILRKNNYQVIQHLGGGSFKTQFKKANNLQAKIAIVIGELEVNNHQLVIKSMLQQTQKTIELDNLLVEIKNIINKEYQNGTL